MINFSSPIAPANRGQQRSMLERFRGRGILKENLVKELNNDKQATNAIIKELKKERLLFGNPVNGTTLYSLTTKGIGELDVPLAKHMFSEGYGQKQLSKESFTKNFLTSWFIFPNILFVL
jgi:hypothetical protein